MNRLDYSKNGKSNQNGHFITTDLEMFVFIAQKLKASLNRNNTLQYFAMSNAFEF